MELNNTIIIFFFVVTFIIIFNIKTKLEKEICKLKNDIKIYEKFTTDDLDQQAMQNFISLAKGEHVNISSMNITGNLKVGGQLVAAGGSEFLGNLKVGGQLVVTGGSDFSGGDHVFRDRESRNGEFIRIGNPWGTPGLWTNTNKIVIGNGKNQNFILQDDSVTVNNQFVFTGNRFQTISGNYELNFGNDGWIRTLKRNTGNMDEYTANIACNVLNLFDGRIQTSNGGSPLLYINNIELLKNNTTVRFLHQQRNAYWNNGDSWMHVSLPTNPYMNIQLIKI